MPNAQRERRDDREAPVPGEQPQSVGGVTAKIFEGRTHGTLTLCGDSSGFRNGGTAIRRVDGGESWR